MLATPVNVLVALVIAGLVSLPVQVEPVAPAVNVPIEPSQEGAGGSGGNAPTSDGDGNQAANKIAAQGSTVEWMCATVDQAPCTETVTLFEETIKVSNPKDLLIEVNAECALWTEVIVVDDDDGGTDPIDVPHSESEARVTVQVLLDGQPVGVTEYDPSGAVVFCDRIHGMTLRENEGDEDNETISNYLRTRNANSFSWIALNVGDWGDGIYHTVKVLAILEGAVNMGEGSAEAAVGKRTLIVEPVGLANDESV